jgi:prolyl oligopeptidase
VVRNTLALALSVTTTLACTDGRMEYPRTRKVDQVDDYHGTRVADPYRWLESVDSSETKA